MSKTNDYIKANRKGSRQAELEDEFGFVGRDKIHRNKKKYSRKQKQKDYGQQGDFGGKFR